MCDICGEALRDAPSLVIRGAVAVHKHCIAADAPTVVPLTPDERTRLILVCFDHGNLVRLLRRRSPDYLCATGLALQIDGSLSQTLDRLRLRMDTGAIRSKTGTCRC